MGIRIFLCGDVMTGRGIDQILAHPSAPRIYEPYLKDARGYLELAESVNGRISHPVSGEYIWGEAVKEWQERSPHVKIINLETSITRSEDAWKGKEINYRMHPQNVDVLTSVDIDVCALANNHVLDWGYEGFRETLRSLRKAGIRFAGAGETERQAMTPAVFDLNSHGRVLVFSMGAQSSGIPEEWRATETRAGVYLLKDLSERTVDEIRRNIEAYRHPGDLIIVSIHWGSNWGYDVPFPDRIFAHRLIDNAGIDLLHGHSSHHPRPFEIYKGKPILYGCGDFINDYEGIRGYEEFRGDLSLMYFFEFDSENRTLTRFEMVPLQIRRFQLHAASAADSRWLWKTLAKELAPYQTRIALRERDHSIAVDLSSHATEHPFPPRNNFLCE